MLPARGACSRHLLTCSDTIVRLCLSLAGSTRLLGGCSRGANRDARKGEENSWRNTSVMSCSRALVMGTRWRCLGCWREALVRSLCGLSGVLLGSQAILELEWQVSEVDSLVAEVGQVAQRLVQFKQLSHHVAEVERDTAIRFEQVESLVNHVDWLARRRSLRANSVKSQCDGGPIARAFFWRVQGYVLSSGWVWRDHRDSPELLTQGWSADQTRLMEIRWSARKPWTSIVVGSDWTSVTMQVWTRIWSMETVRDGMGAKILDSCWTCCLTDSKTTKLAAFEGFVHESQSSDTLDNNTKW